MGATPYALAVRKREERRGEKTGNSYSYPK